MNDNLARRGKNSKIRTKGSICIIISPPLVQWIAAMFCGLDDPGSNPGVVETPFFEKN
jgi:hypothetical protein